MNEKIKQFCKAMSSYKKTSTIKECFYHNKEECKGHIKQSHSLQKNGRLSIIEGEVGGNQCIYTFTSLIPDEKSVIADLKPVGKNEASTFFGFCDYHDTVLFSDIENHAFDDSDKHCFLHSYRSFAHSYHRKHEEYKGFSNQDSDFNRIVPKHYSKLQLEGIKVGVRDLKLKKIELDRMIEAKSFDELEYLTYVKNGLYPIAVSSQLSPPVSYRNKSMNNHFNPDEPYSKPMITVLPDFEQTIVIISAFPDDTKAIELLNELDQLKNLPFEKAITSLIIANCENTFFSPAFWQALGRSKQKQLLYEFDVNTMDETYMDKFFHSKLNFFDERYEANRL